MPIVLAAGNFGRAAADKAGRCQGQPFQTDRGLYLTRKKDPLAEQFCIELSKRIRSAAETPIGPDEDRVGLVQGNYPINIAFGGSLQEQATEILGQRTRDNSPADRSGTNEEYCKMGESFVMITTPFMSFSATNSGET